MLLLLRGLWLYMLLLLRGQWLYMLLLLRGQWLYMLLLLRGQLLYIYSTSTAIHKQSCRRYVPVLVTSQPVYGRPLRSLYYSHGNWQSVHTCAPCVCSHSMSMCHAQRRTIFSAIFIFQTLICQFSSRVLYPVGAHNHLKMIDVSLSVNILDRVCNSRWGTVVVGLMSLVSDISYASSWYSYFIRGSDTTVTAAGK
jgi:hypothetical protein